VAATTQAVLPARAASPIALWHLLSLDAPTVAALWTWFIARVCRVHLPIATPLAMALAVWVLYAGDRLLDARRAGEDGADELEARHLFHHRHRRGFLAGIAVAVGALGALLPSLDATALRLYLAEGALLAAWFLILHASRNAHRLPKEIAVGVFFSAAVFIPTVAREPGLRAELLPMAILLSGLCGLNCLFIYAWEHEGFSGAAVRPPHATTRVAVARLPELGAALAIAGAVAVFLNVPWVIAVACSLAAVLLVMLDRYRGRFARIDLRAAADLALLAPMLLLPFLR
jgi:hypothetical protein